MTSQPAPDSNGAPIRLDDLDRRLISDLSDDPRLALSALGSRLDVTGMTVANRLQRLRKADALRFRVTPNRKAHGLSIEVVGLLQAEVAALEPCEELLRASPYVLRADRVTGEYEIAFTAAFPSKASMGTLVRDLQGIAGVRRLTVHHLLDTLRSSEGWSAVWADRPRGPESSYELAPGAQIPAHLRRYVTLGADWLDAFIQGDIDRLRALSTNDLVFTIMPPWQGAGTFAGFEAVASESRLAGKAYRHLWHRIIGVAEAPDPFSVVIDALNTAERTRGQVRRSYARMAFAFENDHVSEVVSLGQMEFPETPDLSQLRSHAAGD